MGLYANSLTLRAIEIIATARKLLEVDIILIDVHFSRVDLHDASAGCFGRVREFNFAYFSIYEAMTS